MRITRLEASIAEDTSPSDWPVLSNVNIAPRPREAWIEWRGYRLPGETGWAAVPVPGLPAGVPPDYRYEVELGGDEFGTLLGCMPPEAVPEVIDAFLRTAGPEVLGAVAGRIFAHVAAAATSRRGETGA
jgi:hypothetical protein